MYTFCCFPNIFLPLFGGHLIDKFGQRTMMIIFTSSIFLGQFIVSFGCMSHNFDLILLGRFVFGLGESLNISIITILSSYFAQGELAFAVIILFLSTRFCNFFNLLISPVMELEHGVSSAFWIGTAMCACGVVAAFILAEFDEALKFPYANGKRHDTKLDIGRGTHPSSRAPMYNMRRGNNFSRGIFGHIANNSHPKMKSSVCSRLPVVMEDAAVNEAEMGCSANSIIAELKHKQESYGTFSTSNIESSGETDKQCGDIDRDIGTGEHGIKEDNTKFSNKTLLCLFFLCFFLYGAILPFLDMANPIIHIGYFRGHLSGVMSSHEVELWVTHLQAIPIVILAVCAPCVAVAVDYCGHRPSFFVLASTLLVISHSIIASRLGNLSFLVLALVMIGLAHA